MIVPHYLSGLLTIVKFSGSHCKVSYQPVDTKPKLGVVFGS